MNTAPVLTQTLKTEQTLSPQMLQSLALLPMPIMELKAHIQKEIESNPALEIPETEFELPRSDYENRYAGSGQSTDTNLDDADSSHYEMLSDRGAVSQYGTDYGTSGYGSYDPEASDRKQEMIENTAEHGETLSRHLLTQLGESDITDTQYEIGELLIGNLDANGFFIVPLDTLFENRNFSKKEISKVLELVQSFDPYGICVPDFRASLILQAKCSGMKEPDLEIFSKLVNSHLEQLKAGRFRELANSLHISVEDLESYYSILKSLTPYPGRSYDNNADSFIVPEFSVHNKNGTLVLDMNRENLPSLEISPAFSALSDTLSGPEAKETASYINESVRRAKTLIDQVQMRYNTMFKTAKELVQLQSGFFYNGPRYLKPLTLKEVAERVGVHETTMSRLAQSKWVDTDWGLFPMKYFFSQGVSSADGQDSVSRTAVKELIADILKENPRLSDQKISDRLLEKGVKCARRTVSKYRAELNINSSYSRT